MAPKKKKDVFEDLDSEFKTTVDSMTDEEIKRRISEVAIAEHENQANKKQDQDLAERLAQAKMAGEQYREATKANKLRIGYCHALLAARGKV